MRAGQLRSLIVLALSLAALPLEGCGGDTSNDMGAGSPPAETGANDVADENEGLEQGQPVADTSSSSATTSAERSNSSRASERDSDDAASTGDGTDGSNPAEGLIEPEPAGGGAGGMSSDELMDAGTGGSASTDAEDAGGASGEDAGTSPESAPADTCTELRGACTSVGECLQEDGYFTPESVCGGPQAVCCVPHERCGTETIVCCGDGVTFRPACNSDGEFVCVVGEPAAVGSGC